MSKTEFVYTDSTLMPFGKYKNVKMANVPASYLNYLYEEGDLKNHPLLLDYIKDNLEVLRIEMKTQKQVRA